jgi:hypothetical protein
MHRDEIITPGFPGLTPMLGTDNIPILFKGGRRAMACQKKREEKWTLSFDPTLKSVVVKIAKRKGVTSY